MTIHDFTAGQLYVGDCRESLKAMKEQGVTVQMAVTSPPYWGLRSYVADDSPDKSYELGLEPTPEAYVQSMVEVFRLVRDVLADDGTLWLNLGDSYSGSGINDGTKSPGISKAASRGEPIKRPGANRWNCPLKPKDLVGIPWRVAFALQADGWWLRSDIIWHKPNPMPEAVTDRPTKSHEYIFLMAKAGRYFYDLDAVREAVSGNAHSRGTAQHGTGNPKNAIITDDHVKKNTSFSATLDPSLGRNKRTVWTVTTKAFSGAHFATYPPALIEPCILAGTSQRGHCPKCGSRWERVVETGEQLHEHMKACGADSNGEYHGKAQKDYAKGGAQDPSAVKARILAGMREKRTIGWQPTCDCKLEPVPDVVLDPFMGSGTTAMVAESLGRKWVGCELNSEYVKLIENRLRQPSMIGGMV